MRESFVNALELLAIAAAVWMFGSAFFYVLSSLCLSSSFVTRRQR
jgi:hypothetical protein